MLVLILGQINILSNLKVRMLFEYDYKLFVIIQLLCITIIIMSINNIGISKY